jgi:hypothetical protein
MRKMTPRLESLELISLLSAAGSPIAAGAVRLHGARHHRLAAPVAGGHGTDDGGLAVDSDSTLQTLPAQTASLGNTLTNFANLPLSPALNLFNPSLGTLVSVTVTHSAILQSTITSQNLSTTSATSITASLSGSYQINGLNQPIVLPTKTVSSAPMNAGIFGSSTDTVTFPPLQIIDSSSMVFSDAASLAFYTASPGRTTTTATMTANGAAAASAPNGNLFTITQTSASSTVSISYTYMPIPCPTVGKIGRIGVHHQRTLLIVPFSGAVNPVIASNSANYEVITSTGKKIPIISADYNPATNSVTLRPAERLNVHLRFRLSLTLPCVNDGTNEKVTVPFGTKFSLIGFHDKQGRFVSVHNGKIERFDPQRLEGDAHGGPERVHNGKIERFDPRPPLHRPGRIR